jgi:hypothetical protein
MVAMVLLLAGCSTPGRHAAPAPEPEPYARLIQSRSNVVRFEIAVRQFVPARRSGPVIWLTAASHIAETNYFQALQAHLDSQSLVLFEGIGEHRRSHAAPAPTQGKLKNDRSSLQTAMAASLGLVFQLDALDYDRPAFRNSDLSIEELRQLLLRQQSVEGGAGAGRNFETLLQSMQEGSLMDTLMRAGAGLLSVSPHLRALAKLALMEALNEMQADPTRISGLPADWKQLMVVLIQNRNQKVMEDLKTQIRHARRKDSIAVLYGAGHMPDMERRLCPQLHYRPAGQFWVTAFEVDLRRSGITEGEWNFIRRSVQSQMQNQ